MKEEKDFQNDSKFENKSIPSKKMRMSESFVKKVQKNLDAWMDCFSDNNEHYTEMTKFVFAGDQWSDEDKDSMRQSEVKLLTVNMLKKIANSILGEQQQNTPDIQVIPLDDYANQSSASIIQGLLRKHLICTDYKEAEQVQFLNATVGGYGAIRLYNAFKEGKTFAQKINIEPVYDPTCCFWDPLAKKSHKGDGRYCGYYEVISKAEWSMIMKDKEYPETLILPSNFKWCTKDGVVCVYYYEKKKVNKRLVLLETGEALFEEELENRSLLMGLTGEKMPAIIDERMMEEDVVKAYKIIGNYIVEESEFPGNKLPIIFGDNGCSYFIDGRHRIRSFFADAKDSQVRLNYLISKSTDLIRKYNAAQWIATAKNIDGYEELYTDTSRVPGTLLFNPHADSNGTIIEPKRVSPPELPQHFPQQINMAGMDINNIVGVYESQLGMPGAESSGVAIDARVGQGNKNTHLLFNANHRVVDRMGEVLYAMIRALKKGQSTEVIDTKEKGYQQVVINKRVNDYEVENDIQSGDYEVVIKASASFEAQKQSNLEMLIKLAQVMGVVNTPVGPVPAAQMLGDIIADNLSIPGAKEIKGRFEYAIQPQIIAAGKGEKVPPPEPQPNPQAELAQKELELKQQELQVQQERLNLESTKTAAQIEIQESKKEAEITKQALATEASKANAVAKMHEHGTKRHERVIRDLAARGQHLLNP